MKKYMGNYTAEATKALKNSDHLFCSIDEDGAIYVSNGFLIYKMQKYEYAAVAQPAACCEPGTWSIRNGEKADADGPDLVRLFLDAVQETRDTAPMEAAPFTLNTAKKGQTATPYYNAEKDFTALYDTKYISALLPGLTLRSTGDKSPAVAYNGDEPFALVLPIKCDNKTARAVRAFFTGTADSDTNQDAAKLQRQLTQARDEIEALTAQNAQQAAEQVAYLEHGQKREAAYDSLAREYSKLIAENSRLADELEALKNAPQAEQKPEPKTAAEIIASRFADLPGVTVTIKGAQTSAPVVWLTGDTDPHAEELSAAGAKWSNKKSAYYVRVA